MDFDRGRCRIIQRFCDIHHVHQPLFADSKLVDSLIQSSKNYIVIYPNNDKGSEIILNEFKRLEGKNNFRVFPSLRFEYFLTLLKNAEFMIGNSSAGVRETSIYGIPAIDIGNRQQGRYSLKISKNLQHVNEEMGEIMTAIQNVSAYRIEATQFGDGNSTQRFMQTICGKEVWDFEIQKHFIDLYAEKV